LNTVTNSVFTTTKARLEKKIGNLEASAAKP
jgi:hypothetical protein